MGPMLAFVIASTAGASIAGDPDMEWSTDSAPGSPPLEVSPAPAPPPPAARVTAPAPAAPLREPLDKSFRLMIELAVGASPSSMGQVGLGVEADWYLLRFVRLHLSLSGSWVPMSSAYSYYQSSISNRGAVKLLAGVDGVLPFAWGELFVGVASGTTYTSALAGYGCFDCGGYSQWEWQPAMRVRGGFEVSVARPLILGLDLGYGLFARQYAEVHWAELHGRAGFAF